MMRIKLYPGYTSSGEKVIWRDMDNPHLHVSGQSGTGKSFLMRRLVLQAVEQGALVLVFDYTHDFLNYTPPDGLHFQRIDVTSPDFTLNSLIGLPGQSPKAQAQQLLAALHSVFRMGARATISLLQVTAEYLAKSGNPTLDGLLTHISELENPSKALDAAKEPLELLASLVHCDNQPISLDLKTPILTVLDFSNIVDRDLSKLLIELILQTLWIAHTPEQPPLILVLDEAQQLHWGSGSMSVRILREGRKFGIGGWFSSQWLDHKDAASALGQAALQVHFRPDRQHIDKLAKSICSSRPSDLSQCRKVLQDLRRGQFLWQRVGGRPVMVNVDS